MSKQDLLEGKINLRAGGKRKHEMSSFSLSYQLVVTTPKLLLKLVQCLHLSTVLRLTAASPVVCYHNDAAEDKLKAEVTTRHRVQIGAEQAKSHASERTSNISKRPVNAHRIRMWQSHFVTERLQFRIRSLRPESFLVYRGSFTPSRKLPALWRCYVYRTRMTIG